MGIKTKRDSDFSLMTVTGSVSLRELTFWAKKYCSKTPSRLMLWDMTKADLALSARDIVDMSDNIKKIIESSPPKKIAYVFEKSIHFGLGRMYEAHTSTPWHHIQRMCFYDMDEALKWLHK